MFGIFQYQNILAEGLSQPLMIFPRGKWWNIYKYLISFQI